MSDRDRQLEIMMDIVDRYCNGGDVHPLLAHQRLCEGALTLTGQDADPEDPVYMKRAPNLKGVRWYAEKPFRPVAILTKDRVLVLLPPIHAGYEYELIEIGRPRDVLDMT